MFKVGDKVVLYRPHCDFTQAKYVYGTISYVHPAHGWATVDLGPYKESADFSRISALADLPDDVHAVHI